MIRPLIKMFPEGIPGMCSTGTPGHTQNTWEGLHVLSGLGLSRDPPGRAAEIGLGKELHCLTS